jgi:hypothetical protein
LIDGNFYYYKSTSQNIGFCLLSAENQHAAAVSFFRRVLLVFFLIARMFDKRMDALLI